MVSGVCTLNVGRLVTGLEGLGSGTLTVWVQAAGTTQTLALTMPQVHTLRQICLPPAFAVGLGIYA